MNLLRYKMLTQENESSTPIQKKARKAAQQSAMSSYFLALLHNQTVTFGVLCASIASHDLTVCFLDNSIPVIVTDAELRTSMCCTPVAGMRSRIARCLA